MGIFSFGFGGIDVDDIEGMLKKELGNHITNLKVEVHDKLVALFGTCDSMATKEKAILLTGNVKGVEKVNGTNLKAPKPVVPPAPVAQPTQTTTPQTHPVPPDAEIESNFYQIKSGDTLSKIAKNFYGDANKYHALFEANKEVIKDANKIYPGQVIRIPKL